MHTDINRIHEHAYSVLILLCLLPFFVLIFVLNVPN